MSITIETLELDDKKATAVIEAAIPLGAYDGDTVPEDEKQRAQVAEEILGVCLEFWGNGYRGDDVKQLLGVAGAQPDESGELAYTGESVPVKEYPPTPQATPADPPPAADEAPAEEPTQEAEEFPEPWQGYKGSTVAQIKTFINENKDHVDEEVLTILKGYESANSARKGLLKFFDDFGKAEHGDGDTSADDRHNELDEQAQAAADRDPDPVPNDPIEDAKAAEALAQERINNARDEARGALAEAEKEVEGEHHLPGVGERRNEYKRSQFAAARAEREKLPVPPDPRFSEDPVLPEDLTALSHDQVNQLLLDFTACLVRATWLASLAKIDHRHAKRIHSREQAQAFRRASNERDPDTDKPLPEWKVKVVADADEQAQEWAGIVEECKDAVDAFESLRESYKDSVDAISRVEGFRHEEYKRSR